MSSWRDLAADILASRQTEEVAPVSRIAQTGPALPADLANGVLKLSTLRPPRITRPEMWAEVVADAQRLVHEGWAAQAVALGWSATDLFGIGSKDDWEFEGLAVWLRRRSLVLIDERYALAIDGNTREYFNRGGPGHGTQPTVTPVLLWHWGRG